MPPELAAGQVRQQDSEDHVEDAAGDSADGDRLIADGGQLIGPAEGNPTAGSCQGIGPGMVVQDRLEFILQPRQRAIGRTNLQQACRHDSAR